MQVRFTYSYSNEFVNEGYEELADLVVALADNSWGKFSQIVVKEGHRCKIKRKLLELYGLTDGPLPDKERAAQDAMNAVIARERDLHQALEDLKQREEKFQAKLLELQSKSKE
eukprot:gene5492-5485_t